VPLEIAELLERLRVGIGLVPPALWAVIFLAGPSASWLLYRFVVQPRLSRLGRLSAADSLTAMWVCTRCRSVNELRVDRCYRCDARADELDLEVIDSDPLGPSRLRPVGPGLDLDGLRTEPRYRPAPMTGPVPMTGPGPIGRPVGDADQDGPGLGVEPPERAAADQGTGRRRRSPSTRSSVPVGPGRPVASRPSRAVAKADRPSPGDGTAA
jgi:hypothetical protein